MALARRLAYAAPLLALMAAGPVRERYGPPPPPTPYDLCDDAIAAARTTAVPATLLPAIARVESGRVDPATGRVRPWPWTINVEGVGSFYETKEQVIAAVQTFQARGVKSIDVGCMQVNLFHHPTAFPSLDAAFDPAVNAAYAVRFLTGLYAQTKDWNLATAMYHSQTQERGEDYQRRVFGRVMTPMGPAGGAPGAAAGIPGVSVKPDGPYAAWPPKGSVFGAMPPSSYAFGAFAPSAYGAYAPLAPIGAGPGKGRPAPGTRYGATVR